MKKVALLVVLLMAVPAFGQNVLTGTWSHYQSTWGSGATFSNESATSVTISTNGGSHAAYQIIPTTPGMVLTLTGWADQPAASSSYWTEVLLMDDDGRSVAAQLDTAPDNADIQLKSDGWGMNQNVLVGAGQALDVNIWPYANNGSPTLTLVASGTQVIVAMKVGTGGSNNTTNFTDLNLTPEPGSLALLAFGAAPLFLRRRRA